MTFIGMSSGRNFLLGRLCEHQLDYVTGTEFVALPDGFAVDAGPPRLDGFLDEAPAEVAEAPVQVFVEPPLLYRVPHAQGQRLASRLGNAVEQAF